MCGCSTILESMLEGGGGGDDHHSRGASLSEAMEKSASGDTTPIESSDSGHSDTYTPDYDDYEMDDSSGVVAGAATGAFAAAGGDAEGGLRFAVIPVEVAYLYPFNGEIHDMVRFTMEPLSVEGERVHLGFYVGGAVVNFKSGSLVNEATRDPWMLDLGCTFRLYLTRPHTLVSPYLAATMGAQVLYWEYENPVYVGDDVIDSDGLAAVNGYVGLGVTIKRNWPVNLYIEAGVGGTSFVDETHEGFHNDLFHDFGYFSAKAGLMIRF